MFTKIKRLTKKKKGFVTLYFLWIMIFWFVFFLLFINYVISFGLFSRINSAAEEAAQARALAVDVPRKEESGDVEIMRPSSYGGAAYGGASQSTYNTQVLSADQYALDVASKYLGQSSGKNSSNQKIIENVRVCFDYETLDPTNVLPNVTMSCSIGGETISGTYNLESVSDNTSGQVKVKNVVFVGMKVDVHWVFPLKSFLPSSYSNGTYTTSAIAYPQIDSCTRAVAGCE